MSYGIVEYDQEGKPICEICGKAYHRVLGHVRQKHQLTEKEYKKQFGFDVTNGICSKESAERTRVKTKANFVKCIKHNLLVNGVKTQFKVGSKGRTKDKVSEQTKINLTNHIKRIRSTPKEFSN
jgi:hypothetical protein